MKALKAYLGMFLDQKWDEKRTFHNSRIQKELFFEFFVIWGRISNSNPISSVNFFGRIILNE